MIVLNEDLFIAQGLVKKSYLHPTDINLCVKLCQPVEKAKKQLNKELKYLNKIQKKKIKNLPYFFYSRFLGIAETNLGTGYLYDLVFDEVSQEKSKTLEFYLNNKTSTEFDIKLKKAVATLKAQMIQHKMFCSDLVARNICCKILKDSSIQLIIVDGMGHRDVFPIADYLHYFAKNKVNRRFDIADFSF